MVIPPAKTGIARTNKKVVNTIHQINNGQTTGSWIQEGLGSKPVTDVKKFMEPIKDLNPAK